MSDDPGRPDSSQGETEPAVPHFNEAELLQAMRQVMLEHGEEKAPVATDEHSDPFRHLNIDDPELVSANPLLRVGYALLAWLPEGWEVATLNVTAAADEVRTFVSVRVRHGDALSFESLLYLPDVAEACSALRRSTYERDGRGAWYNAIIRLERDGKIIPHYDFEQPPFGYWGPDEVDLVQRDQMLYPRDPAVLPLWHPARADAQRMN